MKFKSFLTAHKVLIKDVVTSTCLLGGSAGVVFGVSAATFKVEYMDLNNAEGRWAAYNSAYNYNSQRIFSQWNMDGVDMPEQWMADENLSQPVTAEHIKKWTDWHPGATNAPFAKRASLEIDKEPGQGGLSDDAVKKRFDYTAMVIDGATHSVLDRSFNQSLFAGMVDFINNRKTPNYTINSAHYLKPSQDNTADFITTYTSAITQYDVIGLAGFNHATPLERMMTHTDLSGRPSPYAFCSDPKTNANAQKTAFVLQDAVIPNNQCIASVLFRADQPGFLTGLATCSYLIHNLKTYHNHYQDLTVAAYGGVSIPTVTIYMGGFERGVELFNYAVLGNCITIGAAGYFNVPNLPPNAYKCRKTFIEDLLAHSKYKDEIRAIYTNPDWSPIEKYDAYNRELSAKLYQEYSIKMIKLGDASNHFSGTFAAGDAIGITKQYLNRGASAIICVAGPQSLDTAQEIQNQGSNAIVIGVDTAMENSDYQRYRAGCNSHTPLNRASGDPYWDEFHDPWGNYSSQAHAIIKFSAVKDMETVMDKELSLIAKGQNWDISDNSEPDKERAVCGPGFQTCGNIMNGLISISWDGFVPLMDAFDHILFRDSNMIDQSLQNAWAGAVAAYRDQMESDEEGSWAKLNANSSEYIGGSPDATSEGIWNVYNAMKFSRYQGGGNESVYSLYYNHTIAILGMLMTKFELPFTRDLTLEPNVRHDPTQGMHIIPIDDPNPTKYYSIREWLDYNMYFSC